MEAVRKMVRVTTVSPSGFLDTKAFMGTATVEANGTLRIQNGDRVSVVAAGVWRDYSEV